MKPKWQKCLSAKDLTHLKDAAGCITLAQFKNTVEHHNKMRAEKPEPMHEPCWDCRRIAHKLGLFVDEG